LTIKNLDFSEGKNTTFVIPAQSDKFKVGELTIDKQGGAIQFSMKFSYTMGDVTVEKYDKAYLYDLPFQKGQSYVLSQGYNGKFSHHNENALDFTMPEGTDVQVARAGTIVEIVQHNTISCATKKCSEYNNYVILMHADGTYSSYVHIQKNSVKLALGSTVNKGDVLAKSGNVCWSNGPHLHFECFIAAFGSRNKIETLFKINTTEKGEMLEEGKSYLKSY
jgi:murein DD-endopeptidase MepM/ murein hydrolase activator NlpD